MSITDLINAMEDIILQGQLPLMHKKSMVNTEEMLGMLDEMRKSLPEEIKAANHVRKEKNKLIVDAQQEAEKIRSDVRREVEARVQQSDIAEEAYAYGNKLVMDARQECEELRQGTFEYLNEKIGELSKTLRSVTSQVEDCRRELEEYLIPEEDGFAEEEIEDDQA